MRNAALAFVRSGTTASASARVERRTNERLEAVTPLGARDAPCRLPARTVQASRLTSPAASGDGQPADGQATDRREADRREAFSPRATRNAQCRLPAKTDRTSRPPLAHRGFGKAATTHRASRRPAALERTTGFDPDARRESASRRSINGQMAIGQAVAVRATRRGNWRRSIRPRSCRWSSDGPPAIGQAADEREAGATRSSQRSVQARRARPQPPSASRATRMYYWSCAMAARISTYALSLPPLRRRYPSLTGKPLS